MKLLTGQTVSPALQTLIEPPTISEIGVGSSARAIAAATNSRAAAAFLLMG